MGNLIGLLSLKGMTNLVGGVVSEPVTYFLDFVIGLSIILVALDLFRKNRAISRFIKSIKKDSKAPFNETDMIVLTIPNRMHRRSLYYFLMFCMSLVIVGSAILAADFGALSFLALFAKNLLVNKFTAFSVLIGFSVFLLACAYQIHLERNKLARFLRRS